MLFLLTLIASSSFILFSCYLWSICIDDNILLYTEISRKKKILCVELNQLVEILQGWLTDKRVLAIAQSQIFLSFQGLMDWIFN